MTLVRSAALVLVALAALVFASPAQPSAAAGQEAVSLLSAATPGSSPASSFGMLPGAVPTLGPEQSLTACGGAAIGAAVLGGAIGFLPGAGVSALIVGSACVANSLLGGIPSDALGAPIVSGVEAALKNTIGRFLRDGLQYVLRNFFSAAGESGNVITQTPPILTHEAGAVIAMHNAAKLFAIVALAIIILWGGYNVMIKQAIGAPYHEVLALLSRVVIAVIMIHLSLSLIGGLISINNAAICFFAGSVEELAKQPLSAIDVGVDRDPIDVELCKPGGVNPPGFDFAFGRADSLLDIVFGLAYGLVLILLVFMMIMRIALIDLLIVLAPIAILLWVLPQTQVWTQRFANILPLTIFTQAAQMLVLLFGMLVLGVAANSVAGGATSDYERPHVSCPGADSGNFALEQEILGGAPWALSLDAVLCDLEVAQRSRQSVEAELRGVNAILASSDAGDVQLPPGREQGLRALHPQLESDLDRALAAELGLFLEYAARADPHGVGVARDELYVLQNQLLHDEDSGFAGRYLGSFITEELRLGDTAAWEIVSFVKAGIDGDDSSLGAFHCDSAATGSLAIIARELAVRDGLCENVDLHVLNNQLTFAMVHWYPDDWEGWVDRWDLVVRTRHDFWPYVLGQIHSLAAESDDPLIRGYGESATLTPRDVVDVLTGNDAAHPIALVFDEWSAAVTAVEEASLADSGTPLLRAQAEASSRGQVLQAEAYLTALVQAWLPSHLYETAGYGGAGNSIQLIFANGHALARYQGSGDSQRRGSARRDQ